MLLEDYASHGLSYPNNEYSIDLSFLGKRGVFRILCLGNEKILVGRRYPPRPRHKKNNEEYELQFYIFFR